MRISNFKLINEVGHSATLKTYFGSVDVTTGILWFRKTKRVNVFRDWGKHWRYLDTGKYTPFDLVENLEEAYNAKKKLEE